MSLMAIIPVVGLAALWGDELEHANVLSARHAETTLESACQELRTCRNPE